MVALLRAGDLYRACGYRYGEAEVLTDRGWAHFRDGDSASARRSLDAALLLYKEFKDELGVATVRNYRGAVRLHGGDPADALEDHRSAPRTARETRSRLDEARALEGVGRCLLASEGAGGEEMLAALRLYRRLSISAGMFLASNLEEVAPPAAS